MKLYNTAKEAIENSICYDEIAYCEDTPENREFLEGECDDSVDAGEVLEFWGTDENMEWRVHITVKGKMEGER